MRSTFFGQLRPAILSLLALSVLTGFLYPLAVTCLAEIAFPKTANGSLIPRAGGGFVGSELVGQPFDAPGYFWSRPSATTPACNGAASSGSNLGPTNPALLDVVRARVEALRAADPSNKRPVPVDLVTASGSGLDPHISPAAAEYQVERVARARGVAPRIVAEIVQRHVENRQLGILGEARVNVLLLNLDLDAALRR
jgi:K+-transporting ATPase ATPase C chain